MAANPFKIDEGEGETLISDIFDISDKLNTDGYLGTVDIEKAKSLKTL